MDEKQLQEIEARAAAATPGPWTDEYEYIEAWGADGLFIAHARDDVPALVAEVRRLKEENDTFRERLSTIFGLGYDYDGWESAEKLKKLIDEIVAIAQGKQDGDA